MKKNIILKEANILIFVSLITLSTIIASGYINNLQVENENDFYFRPNYIRGNVVWDNGMSYTEFMDAVWDEGDDFDVTIADDFMLNKDITVNGVKWIGGYRGSGYQQGNFDWGIVIYDDDGSGNAPGIITNVYIFKPWEYNIVFLEDDGSSIFYEYSVELSEFLNFQASTKYWIAILGIGDVGPISIMGVHTTILLHSAVWGSNFWGFPYWTETSDLYGYPVDMCFQLAGAEADLDCSGALSWTDVEPGSVVTGNFELENVGEEGSRLDWEISETPDWGVWIFDLDEGEDLTPEEGTLTINVTVIAPDEKNSEFDGEIKIVNKENSSDYCIIDASMTTPKNKAFGFYMNFLMWLLKCFPNMFPILRYIVIK